MRRNITGLIDCDTTSGSLENKVPPTTTDIEGQPELGSDAEEFRMETPEQMLVNHDATGNYITGYDTQEVTQTNQCKDRLIGQEVHVCSVR